MRLWGSLPPWAILSLFALAGFGLIIVPAVLAWTWDVGIIHEVGIALLAAAILGFTIDRWMKAEIRTDTFKAALGHVMRPEFRTEVARIIGYKLICERHFLFIEIEKVDDDTVRITSAVERTIRNTSAHAEKIKNYLHIDEWGFAAGKSQIIECTLTLDGKPIPSNKTVADDYTVLATTDEHDFRPSAVAEIHSKWIEYRRINDDNVYHFTTATVDPEIQVKLPAELNCVIGFGTPEQNIYQTRYLIKRRLTGIYFPHQTMSVRWWPKKLKSVAAT
jgi:hypothetical protein